MSDTPQAGRKPSTHIGEGSLRRRIVEYIAQQGGELRSDCGQALQRQICGALGERPIRVSQALLALERRGLLEREMDVERHRCQAIRLASGSARGPITERHRPGNSPWEVALDPGMVGRAHQHRELQAAEQELQALTRQAAEASRRVARLRWALMRANDDRHVPAPG
jgi:DNA-binding MarR family transcriptional regulator